MRLRAGAAASGRRTDRACGHLTRRPTKLCAILSAPARPRLTIFVASASSCFPFCCGTARIYSGGGHWTRWRIGAGWPTRSSNMPRSRSPFRKGSPRSKMRFNACVALRNSSLSSCRNGRWLRSWCLPGDARRFVSRRCDFCRRDRRRARRFDTPRQLDVLPRSCPGGTLDRRPTIRRKGLTLAGNQRARRRRSSRRPGHTAIPRRTARP